MKRQFDRKPIDDPGALAGALGKLLQFAGLHDRPAQPKRGNTVVRISRASATKTPMTIVKAQRRAANKAARKSRQRNRR